jgi:hypothetical protein
MSSRRAAMAAKSSIFCRCGRANSVMRKTTARAIVDRPARNSIVLSTTTVARALLRSTLSRQKMRTVSPPMFPAGVR